MPTEDNNDQDISAKANASQAPAPQEKTAAKKSATKKSAAKDSKPGDQIAVLFVKCKKSHFHRAGLRFTKAGFGVLVSDLSDEQIDSIMSEPMLVVEEGSINADALEGVVRLSQDKAEQD
ncbi:MAG: hypothetical protein RRB22_01140 [Gammaproteobacteria bacterium]|nr:hypothetical protein [Gammaproteobacteria bacterium]